MELCKFFRGGVLRGRWNVEKLHNYPELMRRAVFVRGVGVSEALASELKARWADDKS